jgi:AcrR family transcriptional regulator
MGYTRLMTDVNQTEDGKDERLPLKEACVVEALALIGQVGIEALSLREVARRLGVSHQAPYKHFESKDNLLAEVIRRCFRGFADALRQSAANAATPEEAMTNIGRIYLQYACEHPLEYRLMFSTSWPAPTKRANGLAADARAAFDVLKDRLRALTPLRSDDELDLDAFYIWSAIHGLATVRESDAVSFLDFHEEKRAMAVQHAMNMIKRFV